MKPLRFFCYFLWTQPCSVQIHVLFLLLVFFTAFQAHSSSVKRICQASWYQVWDQKGWSSWSYQGPLWSLISLYLKNIIDFILKICLVSYTAARASVRQRSRHGGGRLCLHVDLKEKVWDSWMHYYNKTYLAFWHFSSLKTMQTYYTPYQNRIGVKNAEIIDKVLPKPSLQYTSMISRCIVLFSLQHI